jgi:putative sterol carrier protein
MAIDHTKQIFDELPTRFNEANAAGWNTTIQFDISGDRGGKYIVDVKDGKCNVQEGTAEKASATIVTSDETWIGVVEGRVNPMTAFTLGQLKVSGNIADVMKLQNMLKA